MLDGTTTAPDEFMHSAEGVDRAEDLARHTLDNIVVLTNIAAVDTTITSMFLLVEVLAALQVHAGLTPEAAMTQVSHLIAGRVIELRGQVQTCPCAAGTVAQPANPAAIN